MAVDASQLARDAGLTLQETARRLGVAPRTLRYWRRDSCQRPCRRGRPRLTVTAAQRREVLLFLHEVTGPAVGLPSLQAWFPRVPRCILAELLRRYRRVWRRRWTVSGWKLTWRRAGAVWAMDFSQAPQLIDGRYDTIFAVRDLGSRKQLAWLPVAGERAEDVHPALHQLFRQHGPPLVLKSDNGSAFISQEVRSLLRSWNVEPLFSPPRRPRYNGALERSNATLKTYTHQHAVRQGHPLAWTTDDLAEAQELANTLPRPWGWEGPSPEDKWRERAPIEDAERSELANELARQREKANEDIGLDDAVPLTRAVEARRDRLALSRALQAMGLLELQRTSHPRPKAKRKGAEEVEHRAADVGLLSANKMPPNGAIAEGESRPAPPKLAKASSPTRPRPKANRKKTEEPSPRTTKARCPTHPPTRISTAENTCGPAFDLRNRTRCRWANRRF